MQSFVAAGAAMARVSWVLILLVSAVAGMVLVGFGLVLFDDRAGPPIIIEDPRADATVVVAVRGAVGSPGVYPLPADARVQDAVAAAGGAAAGADLSGVNLARRVQDEDEVVVPALPPTPDPDRPPPTAAPEPVATTPNPAGAPVNLNTAPVAELDTLPGIGPTLAQRIIDHRTAQGPFQSADQLANVQGISARMADELEPLVTTGP